VVLTVLSLYRIGDALRDALATHSNDRSRGLFCPHRPHRRARTYARAVARNCGRTTARHPVRNLAVTAGGVPQLDLAAIEEKLVHGRRGGYCYEQNSLLQAVLTTLGFRVTALLARVRFGVPADLVTGRSHMVLRIDLPEGPHLIDAGFGNMTLTAPLALTPGRIQSTPHEDFR